MKINQCPWSQTGFGVRAIFTRLGGYRRFDKPGFIPAAKRVKIERTPK